MRELPDTQTRARIRALVIADDPLARSGIEALLVARETPGAGPPAPAHHAIEVVPGCAWIDAASRLAESPGVLVLVADLGGAPEETVDRLEELTAAGERVIALATSAEAARLALLAGARGVLSRTSPGPAVFSAAIQAVLEGLAVVDASFQSLLAPPAADPQPSDLAEPLTARELEVLSLLAEGLSNKAIAARLGTSEHTAKFHVNSILGKLGAGTRTEAVVRAARLGLVVL